MRMHLQSKNIFITGPPGVGKTTLVMNIVEKLRGMNPAGFYTEEIREHGVRRGFRLVSLDGQELILSHTNIGGRFRVGKYGVDVNGFDQYLFKSDLIGSSNELIIIDEIGKMECFSERFKELIINLIMSHKMLIATIALKGTGFMEDLKQRDEIKLFEISRHNRDTIANEIICFLNDEK